MSVPLPPAPYPGLRAFRPEEAAIFCGRAEHRSELLDLLADARFLAVVGASGSGKSSLVLAGLFPDIREGRLIGVDGETARIVSAQPGLRPFMNLARALAAEFKTERPLETLIRRGPAGLIQALDELGHETERSLVLVIDQFEEIFRFADMSEDQLVREESSYAERPLLDGSENEAQAFVNLLLATATQRRHQVFVLLTMRSEFLARCDQFSGLPEAISRSQFLTPRLDRQQLDQAITRPLDLFAATIEPSLVNLILNQISSAQDQLPLMQHCLARMWEVRADNVGPGEFTLTIPGYERVGGLAEALNNHGDALCLLLAEKHGVPEAKIEKFFRALAHHPAAQMAPVRRPVSVAQIAEETGLTTAEVRTIADVFRAEGVHLLMPPLTRTPQLADDSYLDISHESLLRQWRKLRGWLEAEWRQRHMAEELVSSMQEWEKTAPEPRGDIVRRFERWKQAGEAVATRLYRDANPVFFGPHASPTLGVWAKRYGIDWSRLSVFCREAFWWKRVTAVMSKMGAGLVILTLLLLVAVFSAVLQSKRARASAQLATASATEATAQRELAKAEADKARQAQAAAESNAKDAVEKLAASESGFRSQSDSYQQLIGTALKNPEARTPEVIALLDTPALRGLVPAEEPAGSSPTPTDVPISAPIVFDLKVPAKPAPAPVVSIVKGDGGLELIVGVKGVPATSFYNLSAPEAPPNVLEFETTRFFRTPHAHAVIALAEGDRQARIFLQGGQFVSSRKTDQPIASAGPLTLSGRSVVIFGTGNGSVGLWDGEEDSRPRIYPTGQTGVVNGFDFSAAGNVVVASGDDGWAKVWLLQAGEDSFSKKEIPGLQQTFRAGAPVRHATIHPNGQVLLLPIGAASVEIRSLNPKLRAQVATLKHQAPAWFAKFSPDGSMVASSDTTGRVYLWNVASLQSYQATDDSRLPTTFPDPVILSGHRAALTGLEWAPNSDYLVTAGSDGLAIVWQRPQARLRGEFNEVPYLLPRHEGGVSGLAIDPDSRLIATAGADGVARVYPLRPVLRGKFRAWGGPESTGIQGGGDLALLSETDAAEKDYAPYFLSEQPPGTQGLIYRLNPKSHYVNARWDYSLTPRSFLRRAKVLLRRLDASGQPIGKTVEAQPVDWGPPARSGYDFDLSPGLITELGLQAGESIELEIPLLSEGGPPKAAAAAAK